MQHNRGHMPVAPLAAVLQSEVDEEIFMHGHAEAIKERLAGAISIRGIDRILGGEQQSIRFDTADRILIELGCEHLWHQDEALREAYEAIDFSPAKQSSEKITATCVVCGGDFEKRRLERKITCSSECARARRAQDGKVRRARAESRGKPWRERAIRTAEALDVLEETC